LMRFYDDGKHQYTVQVDETTSDALGHYTFPVSFGNSEYRIQVESQGYSDGNSGAFTVGAGQTVRVPTITLQVSHKVDDSFVSGRIVDKAGRPIAGAHVWDFDVSGLVTDTDGTGRFTLYGTPRGETTVMTGNTKWALASGRTDNVIRL